VIEFYLDSQSGISPYLQLVQQVRRAMLLGLLREGDQLPTVKAVVASLTINPNTVSKAYRELEHEGLVAARTGVGTFVAQTLDSKAMSPSGTLQRGLMRWLTSAREAGLNDDGIEALFSECLRATVVPANVS
jgi:GntR family transcriptional regulator